MKPGDARCPGPSTSEIIASDSKPAPSVLTDESYEFLGNEDLPFSRYTSRKFFDEEVEQLWPRTWQWACREEHIPEPGDYYVYDIARFSLIIMRSEDGKIRGFYNSCLHRGVQLKASGTNGRAKVIRCAFHGFTWDIQGNLADIPCRWDFPHIKDEDFALPQVHVETWGGFVFINMDDEPVPLKQHLGPLAAHFSDRWDLSQRYIETHVEKVLPANWKAAQEAFIEAYHVLETHPEAIKVAGDANTQYDVFDENVSRFVQTLGYPSPHLKREFSESEKLEYLSGGTLKLEEGQTARGVYAEHLRQTLGEQYKVDLASHSDSEMIDSIEYHLFPNMFLFPGVSLPMIYRFRPNGLDVDSCIFDVLFLRPKPIDGQAPFPPKVHSLKVEDSFTEVPNISPGLGHVFDQDTAILNMQRKGQATSNKKGATLGNYQEIRIRNIHRTLDKYLK